MSCLASWRPLLVPFGDLAWRVTLLSAFCAALAVALFFLLARRATGSVAAAFVAALALGFAPGLWNAATLAEVYALLAALLAALGYLLLGDHGRLTTDHRLAEDRGSRIEDRQPAILDSRFSIRDPQSSSPAHPLTRSPARLYAAAFVAGLGCTHHGLFVLTGLPLLVGYLLWRRPTTDHRPPTADSERHETSATDNGQLTTDDGRGGARLRFTFYVLASLALLLRRVSLTPWLYPLAQYARYGPFDGWDYGLPQHYFWGAPRSWSEVFDLIGGGVVRRGIFRLPTADEALAVLQLVAERMWFEFGPLGVALGLFGSVALLWRSRVAWVGAAWIFLVTLAYLLLLGPAVADAPVFTLPMLLPWALWIAAAVGLAPAPR